MRRQITGNYLGKWWWGGTSSFTKAGGKNADSFQPEKGFPSNVTWENIHRCAQLCPFLC